MLSRIAEALYDTGRDIERAQYVVRILEVQHKMQLALPTWTASTGWLPFYEAFDVPLREDPTEEALYDVLVLGADHPYSARARLAAARERSRALRETLSEEMWEHLNRFHHELAPLVFDDIRQIGRTEFNRRIGTFCDGFFGLANNTLIRGPEVHFLRIGKFVERAWMLCRILEIRRKMLALSPDDAGRPIDFRRWQGLLRFVSGYEPYRRVYDARIVPEQVLEFLLSHPSFPRSYLYSLTRVHQSLGAVGIDRHLHGGLLDDVEQTLEAARNESVVGFEGQDFGARVSVLSRRCKVIDEGVRAAFFRSQLPASQATNAHPTTHIQVQQ